MPKTRTNISIDADMLAEARELGFNVSALAEGALRDALKHERARLWREENAEALEAYRERIERDGTLLAQWQVLKID